MLTSWPPWRWWLFGFATMRRSIRSSCSPVSAGGVPPLRAAWRRPRPCAPVNLHGSLFDRFWFVQQRGVSSDPGSARPASRNWTRTDLDLVRAADQPELSLSSSCKPSATGTTPDASSSCWPRGSRRASGWQSRGDLEGRRARIDRDARREPRVDGLPAGHDAPVNVSLLRDVRVAHSRRSVCVPLMSGHESPLDLHHRELRVGRDEAQNRRRRGSGVRRHRRRRAPRRSPARAPRSSSTRRAARSSPGSMCRRGKQVRRSLAGPRCRHSWAWKLEKSRPRVNARPSPESTTARSDRSRASSAPVATSGFEHRGLERVHLLGAIEAHVRDAPPVSSPRPDPTSLL